MQYETFMTFYSDDDTRIVALTPARKKRHQIVDIPCQTFKIAGYTGGVIADTGYLIATVTIQSYENDDYRIEMHSGSYRDPQWMYIDNRNSLPDVMRLIFRKLTRDEWVPAPFRHAAREKLNDIYYFTLTISNPRERTSIRLEIERRESDLRTQLQATRCRVNEQRGVCDLCPSTERLEKASGGWICDVCRGDA